jgi:hypothetical protein
MNHIDTQQVSPGLKPALLAAVSGTAKAVPFPKPFMRCFWVLFTKPRYFANS